MFQINCPHCGIRDAGEFRYGGEVLARPQDNPGDAAWLEYVFLRANVLGVQREWWYHRLGCQRWFRLERSTHTNQVQDREGAED